MVATSEKFVLLDKLVMMQAGTQHHTRMALHQLLDFHCTLSQDVCL